MAGLRGRTRSDGWVLGGYVTHYTPSGWYVDAVAQLDWLDHRLTAEDGTSGGTRSRGFVGSVEVGKAFGSKWKLEPQLQLIYGNTDLNDFSDTANVANRISIEDSLTGRAGFRLKRTWDYDKASDGGLFTFYAKANVWGRLDGGQIRITVGPSAPGEVQFKEVWGDVGLGSTFSISKTAELFFDADVEYGID
jgi:outer membrane autotransporter protein